MASELVYQEDAYKKELTAKVVKIVNSSVYLDKTIFTPKSAELYDLGTISGIPVISVTKEESEIVHTLKSSPSFKVSDNVKLKLDWDRRYTIMRMHSALHLLAGCFEKLEKARAVAGSVGLETSKLIFKDKPSDIAEAIKLANEYIKKDIKFYTYFDKVKKGFRWCKAGDLAPIPCGGVHIKSAGEIKLIRAVDNKTKSGKFEIEFAIASDLGEKVAETLSKQFKIAESLQEAEIEVLKHLSKSKKSTAGELATQSKLQEVAVGRAVMWLENKKLATSKKSTTKFITLDELGKKYAKEGLPELRILKDVSSPKTIQELTKKYDADEVKFAIGNLKKKGLIILDQGKMKAVPYVKTTDTAESKLLNKLAKGALDVNSLTNEEVEAYSELKRRAIAKDTERVIVSVEISKEGLDVAKEIPKLVKDRVGALTSGMLKTGSWKGKMFRRYDVEAFVPVAHGGLKQRYLEFIEDVKQELMSMGFQEERPGPKVEASFFNCDALFMPQDHPARGIHDAYFVKGKADLKKYKDAIKRVAEVHENGGKTGSKGWGYKFSEDITEQLVLPTQDTANSPRSLLSKELKIPGKYFTVARCYRPDVVDWKHLTEFNQMGGFVLGENLNFRQLLGLLVDFCKRISGTSEVKFSPAYFPFVEPGLEASIKIDGKWVEVVGAGIFRPELCKPLGIDVPVLAWGFGLDRLFMIREGIKDIRQLFSDDLNWLRGAKDNENNSR